MEFRDLLTEKLTAWGFAPSLAQTAQWGAAITPGGNGASRLGGLPALPREVPWPRRGGQRLTHIATLALGEIPAFPGREVLPYEGSLLVFAEIRDPRELWDSVVPAHSDAAQLIYVGPHEVLELATDVDDPEVVLSDLAVTYTPVLTVPSELEFDEIEADVRWGRMCLEYGDAVSDLASGHLILGLPFGDARLPEELNLLYVCADGRLGELGLNFGNLALHAPPDVLARRDWSLVQFTAMPD